MKIKKIKITTHDVIVTTDFEAWAYDLDRFEISLRAAKHLGKENAEKGWVKYRVKDAAEVMVAVVDQRIESCISKMFSKRTGK